MQNIIQKIYVYIILDSYISNNVANTEAKDRTLSTMEPDHIVVTEAVHESLWIEAFWMNWVNTMHNVLAINLDKQSKRQECYWTFDKLRNKKAGWVRYAPTMDFFRRIQHYTFVLDVFKEKKRDDDVEKII